VALTKVRGSGLDGATALKNQELILDTDGDTSIQATTDDTVVIKTSNTTGMTITSDGTFLPQKVPCAFMYRNGSGGNAAADSWTKIAFDAEEFDVGGIADTTDNRFEFTTATAGVYFFSASIRLVQTSILNRAIISLRKNAGTYLGQMEINIPDITGTMYPQIHCNSIVSVADGDYIDAAYYITSGATTTISNTRSATNMFCYRISA